VAPATTTAPCPDCGVIAAIHEVKQAGEATGVGAVAGGVLGGVVGHQFGGGRGKDAMTVVGAVGGAVAGHQIEKQARAKVVYRVDVRMEDGSLRSITQSTAPTFPVGAKVRVNGNQLVARG
jgi:outer membrane lipoprotein SlyB